MSQLVTYLNELHAKNRIFSILFFIFLLKYMLFFSPEIDRNVFIHIIFDDILVVTLITFYYNKLNTTLFIIYSGRNKYEFTGNFEIFSRTNQQKFIIYFKLEFYNKPS